MMRWLAISGTVGVALFAVSGWMLGVFQPSPEVNASGTEARPATQVPPAPKEPGGKLLAGADAAVPDPPANGPPSGTIALTPIVVPDCRLTVIQKQEVPSQRSGQILFIGTELRPEEEAQAAKDDRLIIEKIGNKVMKFRLLKPGDEVKKEQLLAVVDPTLALDDLDIKKAKVVAAEAERKASAKTRDEAENRYKTSERLYNSGGKAVALEELRGAELAWHRYHEEEVSKAEAVKVALAEAKQSQTTRDLYDIRSKIPGVIKTVYKNQGDAIKELDPVMQIHNHDKLRLEGLVDVMYLPDLRQNMQVVVEPTLLESPMQVLPGHLKEVTGVAVSNDPVDPKVVSASEDGTVRVWDRTTGRTRRTLHLQPQVAVRAVACTPPGAAKNACLAGYADGSARIWDLANGASQPVLLQERHKGAINCVAFSSDGKFCATGGEDRSICLSETATGKLLYRFPTGHGGAVTSLQFTPLSQLVSAGRDNSLLVWDLHEGAARIETRLLHRTGDVTTLGTSPNGKHVLFDQGKKLHILSLPEGQPEYVLENPSGATNFTTMALFSPDGQLILTSGGSEGRVQLWRVPSATTRAHEVRQLGTAGQVATCGAFAPGGRAVVTGTRDGRVFVWPVPSKELLARPLVANVTFIDRALDASARQVRIWAEVANPDGKLVPGGTATMVIYRNK